MKKTIFDFLKTHAEATPDKTAIISKENSKNFTSTSYSELYAHAQKFAADISSSTKEQDIIPVFLRRSISMVACLLGAISAGRCAAPLNNKLKSPQICRIIRQSTAEVAYIDSISLLSLRTAESGLDVGNCEWRWIDHESASKIHVKTAERISEDTRIVRWQYSETVSTILGQIGNLEQLTGICLFTSGSTGFPKGILITNSDLVNRAVAEVDWYGLDREDVLLNILPFSFDVGLNQLLSTLVAGCTMVILDSWMPADIINTVQEHGITGISGVPSVWQDFLNSRMTFHTDSGECPLRYITVSGGDLSREYLQCLPRLGNDLEIFKTYGQTEAFRATSLKPEHFYDKMESVGQAFTGVRILVLREDGTQADINETGEVVHIGLGTMHAYLDDEQPDEKKRSNPYPIHDKDYSHAIFTGDHGSLDKDGFLCLKGRMDTMLKVSGNRVYPNEIVSQLLSLQKVLEAEIIAVRNAGDEVALVAFLVPEQEGSELTAIQEELGQKLPSYMMPKRFEVRSSLPRTASGKPDLKALQHEAELMFQIKTEG